MRSPFPGMDPYIEACGLWEDFHDALIAQIRDELTQSVPDHYVVRFGERSYVELVSSEQIGQPDRHSSQADVTIACAPGKSPSPDATATAVADLPATNVVDGPITMRALVEMDFRESFVEVYALRPERRLVTTVEVLSPSNKRYRSPGWVRYWRKRQAHLEGAANLVEIDLLRGGRRMPMEDPWPDSPYYVLVSRRPSAPRCAVWPAYCLQPLAQIPVPLSPPDADVLLALQPMIEAIYGRSRYGLDIDYRRPCRPRLDDRHARWLREHLSSSPEEDRESPGPSDRMPT
jgi:hypothetical protein